MRAELLPCLVLALALTACRESAPTGPPTRLEFPESALVLAIPPGWTNIAGDIQNRHATQFTFKLESLEGARADFRQALPESILPELVNWTRFHFMDVVERSRQASTVGGLPALEVTYECKVRAGAQWTTARYWVVVRESYLYLFRIVFPAGRLASDEAEGTALIGSIEFLPLPTGTGAPILFSPLE